MDFLENCEFKERFCDVDNEECGIFESGKVVIVLL